MVRQRRVNGATKREKEGKKTISGGRNKDTHLQYHKGYKIQRDSILKIGTKTSKRKTIGNCQISGRKSHRGCFEMELSQVSVLNTPGADAAHLQTRYEISRCGEG